MSNHRKPLIFGSFNAERYWQNHLYGTLPSFRDEQADLIVAAMDEIQFVFSKREECLVVTRFAMNGAHLRYLAELGFRFTNMGMTEVGSTSQVTEIEQSVTTALYQQVKYDNAFLTLNKEDVKLDPYAIVTDHSSLTGILEPDGYFPDVDTVKHVNSKVFSTMISNQLEKGAGGIVVTSAESLQRQAEIMLNDSPVMIKDPFGVSGNGNILIKKTSTLRPVVRHLMSQEQSGKIINLILEPFLDKQIDFSCQGMIDQTGTFEILSFHIIYNDKFRFSGIEHADEAFVKRIESLGYAAYITSACRIIFESGYTGPVCIDSMILSNGELIPVVEINARKSMGLINHSLFTFLTDINKDFKCKMMTLNFTVEYRLSFDQVLQELKNDGLLFVTGMLNGILPLSANTVDINSMLMAHGPFKGKFYYHIIYSSPADRDHLQEKAERLFEKLGVKII
ncbi:ATP-binding protein [Pedobacter hartonius]|uniref:Carbamoyl-phosphate synthase L chain, ATP binding domain n=1 Tax=Pedobacter hartonius TaxID=425514 RepID=A0A1H4GDB7_9SPHI|nr:hypothetical protein [Pedobacter hartonius]SEB06980.1 Carbamoyl-phosphate synthase L chain, ATP binding domain [Pedobacter hartonius]